MRFFFIWSLLLVPAGIRAQFAGNQSPEYPKLAAFYDSLSKADPRIELYAMGSSDYGLPIYLCVLNGAGDSLKTFEKARNSTTVFINNGIHPGEPDGINACGQLVLEYLEKPEIFPKYVVIAFTLCYNVGGAMTRSGTSRANQLGPEEYGFRGNAQNLDLNRDFIKMDSENMFTFARIYHGLDPDVFVDTHVSNGADYQYTLTLIYSVKERMTSPLRELTYEKMVPEMQREMLKQKLEIFPYIELKGETPDSGIEGFNDLPRYSMGYASLFHAVSVTIETHMLKPFEMRVDATNRYLRTLISWTGKNAEMLEAYRAKAIGEDLAAKDFRYSYQLTYQVDSLFFKGYRHGHKPSEVSGLDRLYYDRSQPWNRNVPYFNHFVPRDSAKIPQYYIVGAQCRDVIDRLEANGIVFRSMTHDSTLTATVFRIEDFGQTERPYEGHYLHHSTEAAESAETIQLKRGDVLVPVRQKNQRFILTVLEPESEDSYFAWNFFDSYLQEKEYFSSYVFEDIAAALLKGNPSLREALENKKRSDEAFRNSAWQQLYFVYQHSPYFEPGFMRLPVYKIY